MWNHGFLSRACAQLRNWHQPARAAGLLGLIVLVSCGGGGGGSGGSSGPSGSKPSNGWLSFNPSPVELTSYVGDVPPEFTLSVTVSKVLDGTTYIGFVDAKGVTSGSLEFIAQSADRYSAKMQIVYGLPEGIHEGRFEVRLCRDDPRVCATPIEGSPWYVPYKITVNKASNLTPLAPLPGATASGDAARTGYINADISAANFSRRWITDANLHGAVFDAGRILAFSGSGLAAYSEADGRKLWGRSDGGGTTERDYYSRAVASKGKLWVIAQGYNRNQGEIMAELMAFDAADGSIAFEVGLEAPPTSARWEKPFIEAPVIDGGMLYSGSGSGTIRRSSESTGKTLWTSKPSPDPLPGPRNGLSVSYANGQVVGFDGTSLWAVNANTGAPLFSISADLSPALTYQGAAPVLGSAGMAYVSSNYNDNTGVAIGGRLMAFDLASRSVRWAREERISSDPVEKNGVVYVTQQSLVLVALDGSSGAELWRWTPAVASLGPFISKSNLLVVGKYAFLSMGEATYAVDLDTHKTAWQYPMAGGLAVSPNGTLTITGNGKVAAINLR